MFVGSFIFIDHGYDSLGSIYQNNDTPQPFPETAKKVRDYEGINTNKDNFLGTYETVWLEPGNNLKAELTILPHPSYNRSYQLKWANISSGHPPKGYEGLGMLYEGKLVGCYWEIK